MDNITSFFKFLGLSFSDNFIFAGTIIVIFIGSIIASIYINSKNLQRLKDANIEDMDHLDFETLKDKYGYFVEFKQIPGILMSIGIIGTFYLIYDSLGRQLPSIDTNNISEVLEVISHHIAPAFSISALGILSSIAFVVIEIGIKYVIFEKGFDWTKVKEPDTFDKTLKKQEQLLSSINQRLMPLETLGTDLQSFGNTSKNLEVAINNLGEILDPQKLGAVIGESIGNTIDEPLGKISDIAKSINTSSKNLETFIKEDFSRDIVAPLHKSVDKTHNIVSQLSDTLIETNTAIKITNDNFNKLQENLITLDNSLNGFVNNTEKVLEEHREQFSNIYKEITGTFKIVKDATESTMKQFEQISQSTESLLNTLEEDLKKSISNAGDAVVTAGETAASSIENSVNGIEKSIEIVSQSASTMISQSGTEARETISAMKDVIVQAGEQTEETINTVSESLHGVVETANNTVKIAGEQAAESITLANDNLESTLDGVNDALVKTSSTIQEELTIFRNEYTDSLEKFLQTQSEQLSKVLNGQIENLKDVTKGFSEVLEKDIESRQDLNKDLDELISKTNGFVSSTQQIIATKLDEQENQLIDFLGKSKQIQNTFESMTGHLQEVDGNLDKGFTKLFDHTKTQLKEFNSSQNNILSNYRKEADTHLRDIFDNLKGILEVMMAQADRLENKK